MDQDFVAAGAVIGQFMITNGPIKQGASVFCPVEDPTATYAVQRIQGVNQALSAIGAKCDVLATGDSDADAKTSGGVPDRPQDHIRHHANGGILFGAAPAALAQAGMTIPVGGFDIYDPRIPAAIKAGKILGAVDQQFYSQAFYAAMQPALELQYGLFPSDMDTGGRGVVTKTNVDSVISLSGTYR